MLRFKIVTPDGIIYEDEIDEVTVPTTTGEISILTNHIPLVSVVTPGELIIKKSGNSVPLYVSSGIIEVRPHNEVYVMADNAERAENIDIEAAAAAKKRAEELLAEQKHIEDTDFAKIQASIEKELARIHVGRKYRHIKSPPIE